MNNEEVDRKYWAAYTLLEKTASRGKYRPIGLLFALNLLRVQLGVSNKKAQGILRCLSKSPYKWINLEGGQISVKPIKDEGGEK